MCNNVAVAQLIECLVGVSKDPGLIPSWGDFFSLQFLGLWPMAADKKIAERIRRFTVAVTVEISYIFVIIDKLYAN